MKNKFFLLPIVAAVVLAVGCFHLPIGYYTFLRIVVFVVAGLLIFLSKYEGINWQCVVNGLVAILFNPIIPVHLHSRPVWAVIDAVVAAWFVWQAARLTMLYIGQQNHANDKFKHYEP